MSSSKEGKRLLLLIYNIMQPLVLFQCGSGEDVKYERCLSVGVGVGLIFVSCTNILKCLNNLLINFFLIFRILKSLRT